MALKAKLHGLLYLYNFFFLNYSRGTFMAVFALPVFGVFHFNAFYRIENDNERNERAVN